MLTRYRFLMTYIDVTLFCYYCVGGTVNRTNAFFLQLQASGLHHLSLGRKGFPPPSLEMPYYLPPSIMNGKINIIVIIITIIMIIHQCWSCLSAF